MHVHIKQVTGEPQTHRHTYMYTDLSVKQCDRLYLEVLMSVMSFHHVPENNLETVNHSVPAGVSRPRRVLICVCIVRAEGWA